MNTTRLLIAVLLAGFAASCGPTGASFSISREFSVNVRATYLRAQADNPVNPVIIDLEDLGIAPGFTVELESNGQYYRNSADQPSVRVGAVFSTSHTVYPADSAHRVPGAIDAGDDVLTDNTQNGDLPTDIEEDFTIQPDGRTVTVPDGAKFLMLGIHDDYMADNTDAPGGFSIKVTW